MAEYPCGHTKQPDGAPPDEICASCNPHLLQCQQRECRRWQEFAPTCRHCHATLTGPLSGQEIHWDDCDLLIRERLGSGGMGEVYRGFIRQSAPSFLQEVAVKFNKEIGQASRFARFKREVSHLAKLESPYCVKVLGYGEQLNTGILQAQFMVMECLHGRDLATLLSSGPLLPKDVLSLGLQLFEALAQIHQKGVLHRDLKPDNIMLVNPSAAPLQAKLFDFGLAKDLNTYTPDVSGSGIVMGTPWYMSPEQAKGEPLDQRSDLFSLGIVIYEMLTATRPYPANNLYELFQLHLQPPPLIPIQLPHPLPALLRGTLAYLPDDRFPRADACVALLQDRQSHPRYDYFQPLMPSVSPATSGAFRLPQEQAPSPPLPSYMSLLILIVILFVLGSGTMAYLLFNRASSSTIALSQTKVPRIQSTPRQRPLTNPKPITPRPTSLGKVNLPKPSPLSSPDGQRIPLSKRRKHRRKTIIPKPWLQLVLQPPCTQLQMLHPTPKTLAQRELQLPPGHYKFLCISKHIRLKRSFVVNVKLRPQRQLFKRQWHPIQAKLLIPLWAYPYADSFLIPQCQIGCPLQLWSGVTKIELKRPIQGTKQRAIVHTRALQLPESLRTAPASQRTFVIRWDPQTKD